MAVNSSSESNHQKIRIGLIGAGSRGIVNLNYALRDPNVELTAVCDVYDGRTARAKELYGEQIFTTRHHEELLARPDVDAVIVSTTHHWNAQISIDALNAGKAVYVEKPVIQYIEEGKPLIEAEAKSSLTLCVGSQKVTNKLYMKAKELYESGAIGQLVHVEAWWDRNTHMGAWQYTIAPDASPENVDWKRFLGNAPETAFDPQRVFRWRNYKEYSTGVAGDLYVHLFSGLHNIIGAIGPNRIYASGGIRYWNDGRDVPDLLLSIYDYAATDAHSAFNVALRVNFTDGGGGGNGFRIVGTEGTLTMFDKLLVLKKRKRGDPGFRVNTFTEAVQEQYKALHYQQYPDRQPEMFDPEVQEFHAPEGYDDIEDHIFDWLAAVRAKRPVVENALFGFRAAAPAILSQESYFTGQPVNWDPIGLIKG